MKQFPESPNWIGWIVILFALAIVWKILSLDISEIDIKDWITVHSSARKVQSLSDIYTIVALIFS
jgi:hypothetical protein